jgi:hypothetical protein
MASMTGVYDSHLATGPNGFSPNGGGSIAHGLKAFTIMRDNTGSNTFRLPINALPVSTNIVKATNAHLQSLYNLHHVSTRRIVYTFLTTLPLFLLRSVLQRTLVKHYRNYTRSLPVNGVYTILYAQTKDKNLLIRSNTDMPKPSVTVPSKTAAVPLPLHYSVLQKNLSSSGGTDFQTANQCRVLIEEANLPALQEL